MSRMYELDMEVTKTKINEMEFKKILTIFGQEWGGRNTNGTIIQYGKGYDTAIIDAEGTLCGGESDKEAHRRIRDAIKKEISDCSVKTRWTYLEELPYEEYID